MSPGKRMLTDLADRVRGSMLWQRHLSHSRFGHYIKGVVRRAGLFGRGQGREFYDRAGLKDTLLSDIAVYCARFSGELYYPKSVEYPAAVRALEPRSGEKILDLATMCSPLPSYIARRFGCTVACTDVYENWENEFRQALTGAGEAELLSDHRVELFKEDIRRLSFPDNSFDKVYSISSIEHLPKDGDIRAIEEMARVLKPGGTAFVTVEAAAQYFESWFRDDKVFNGIEYEKEYAEQGGGGAGGRLFFGRYYDREALSKRLVDVGCLRATDHGFWGERLAIRRQFDYPQRYSNGWDALRALQPVLASVSMVRIPDGESLEGYSGLIGFVQYRKT
jgi:SAM-dependent methyltransferase